MSAIDHDVCGIGRVSYGIKWCAGCGMIYQSPITNPAAIDAQYQAFSNYIFSAPPVPPVMEPGQRLMALLEETNIPKGKAFDVGTATGDFLYHLRNLGWDVSGCDPTPKAVELARSAYGLDVALGGDHEVLPQRAGLDLITFSHVLEHVPEPSESLRRARNALADGGHVAFEFPCFVQPASMPPGIFMMEHLNYFSEEPVRLMVENCGFELVKYKLGYWTMHYPVITVVAKKLPHPVKPQAPTNSRETLALCEEYLAHEKRVWNSVAERINAKFDANQEAYLWAAGLHTSILLELTPIASRVKILGILDRDIQKHGQTLGPYEVLGGVNAIENKDATIVVSSNVNRLDIIRDLRAAGIPDTRLLNLYD
jgi:SAM-dependent methyltransferase